MESDFRFDERLDLPLDDLGHDDGAGDVPPPEEPGPERGPAPRSPRPADPAPVTGPWFGLSMGVFVAWGLLTLIGMSLRREAGELGAWALILGFIGLYCGFLYLGARWFDGWRRA